MVSASPQMMDYFLEIKDKVSRAHKVASEAKLLNIDPEPKVEISIAENMAERVVGLISVIAPQIVNSGVVERIQELEKQYGVLDWRVALKIAEEVAVEKFCKFKDKNEAMSVGIRTGFAYSTVGVVASPLDGIIDIQVKKRLDNRGEYICLIFAGPIRNAGGTNAALSVIIADYVRIKLGYDCYDANELEVKRSISEIRDYDERISPRQHKPSDDEIKILIGNIPVEVGGDPSETIEVSNFKNLPRIPTNLIRSGFCLICTDCIPLKAPKLWKQLSVWGKDFGLDHWKFLADLIDAQKKAKAKGGDKKEDKGVVPNYSFIADLVAGRPVIGYPLRAGGFRLRYGRSRASGYSAQTINPATMVVLDKYLATGTQIKVERPGKAATLTTSEFVEGPIVKLVNGDVVYLDGFKKAKAVSSDVAEILFLGDLLIAYGDFLNRAHVLVPAGYCEEWWVQELEKSSVGLFGTIDAEKISNLSSVSSEFVADILKNPLTRIPSGFDAVLLSKSLKIPLHPRYTLHFSLISKDDFVSLLNWFKKANVIKNDDVVEKIVLPYGAEKRVLELIGCPHKNVNDEFVVIEKDFADVLNVLFSLDSKLDELINSACSSDLKVLDLINSFGALKLRDKSGVFVGSRMGRPEKAKQRKMTGSPHVLFPVGEQGGKFRSFQSALESGFVESNFSVFYCESCGKDVVYPSCTTCLKPAKRLYFCKFCGKMFDESCPKHGKNILFSKFKFNIKEEFVNCLKHLNMKSYPDLIKGARGTSNKEHYPEHLSKGILRAKNDVFVFKDGTSRYDMTQLPITHFKPKEVGVSVGKLKELGYVKDIKDKDLIDDDQLLELKPQDVILPGCDVSTDEGAETVLFRISKFIDDALVSLYKKESFYNCATPQDLVGHLVICLAPHTSAGTVGRIIGFSKTQGFLAHPLMHAATRRDCDGDEACVMLLMDGFLNFSKHFLPTSRGATMDASLVLTYLINPAEVDDMVFDVDVSWRYPLELYEASLQYKLPWEVGVETLKKRLGTPKQYEGMGFTHDIDDINNTVRCSAYKTLPTMEDKLKGQMFLAEKLRSVNATDVASMVIEKHFLKDTKGNLRKFSMQEFRCVNCNAKYRRPPLLGKCKECNNGKIIFTISEGSIVKYLEPSLSLAEKYNVSDYLKQTLDLLQQRVEGVFGKEKEKQVGLGSWF